MEAFPVLYTPSTGPTQPPAAPYSFLYLLHGIAP